MRKGKLPHMSTLCHASFHCRPDLRRQFLKQISLLAKLLLDKRAQMVISPHSRVSCTIMKLRSRCIRCSSTAIHVQTFFALHYENFTALGPEWPAMYARSFLTLKHACLSVEYLTSTSAAKPHVVRRPLDCGSAHITSLCCALFLASFGCLKAKGAIKSTSQHACKQTCHVLGPKC